MRRKFGLPLNRILIAFVGNFEQRKGALRVVEAIQDIKGVSGIFVGSGEEAPKGDNVIVFKYKSKVRYRKKTGHRQIYTTLAIDSINPAGAVSEKPKKSRAREKEVTEDGA